MQKCPGQDTRFWTPDDVTEILCGNCSYVLEFFKTEGSRRCPECGNRVVNPAVSLGCAQWCEHARDCRGFDPSTLETQSRGEDSLADKLIRAVKDELAGDQKRVSHALRVLGHAEDLLRNEQGQPRVVIAAALLHDVGIHAAERKHGSSAPRYQQTEGPAIARRILRGLQVDEETIEHVCQIVAHHHSGWDKETPEFRIIWDADWLVNFPEEFADVEGEDLEGIITKTFKTETGRKKAQNLFLRSPAKSANDDTA